MSVYLTPVTFEGQHIAPSDDGAAWATSVTDGISSGCELSRSGTTLTIAAGKLIGAGRTARVDASQSFTIGSAGYSRLVLTIDLSKTAEQQVALDVQNSSTMAGFPSLTQNDINSGGTQYQFVVCVTDNSASGILWKCGRSHSRGYGTQVTLPVSGWANNQQTVYVDGVLADTNAIVTFAPESQAVWDAAVIVPLSQGDGTITFQCTTVPTAAVTSNILLY